jgi:hypothetical protein
MPRIRIVSTTLNLSNDWYELTKIKISQPHYRPGTTKFLIFARGVALEAEVTM